MQDSTKDFATQPTQFGSASHLLQRQQPRGRRAAAAIVLQKSPTVLATRFLHLCLLLVPLCCFFQYADAFLQQHQPTMTRQRPFGLLWQRSSSWLLQESGTKFGRSSSTLSSRLYSSVATTTSTAVTTATTTMTMENKNVADTTTSSSSSFSSSSPSSSVVELKYMDYLPHHDISGTSSTTKQQVPIVFLHGLLGNKKNFATIATSLGNQLKKKRRIIGLDLRNHGDNHHDWRDSMNYSEMAQDLLAFLDAHNIPKAVLVGHSMGGKVAQAVALTEPSRVDGLVVLDIAPVAYSNDEPHWKAVQDIVTVLAKIPVGPGVTRRDVDVQLRSAIPDPALRAFCLTNFDATQGQWKIHIQAICAQLDEIASFDIAPLNSNGKSIEEEQLSPTHQYPGDAFFIHGGQSRFVRHAYIPAIQSYFPNHMLTTVRGAGHWIHAEKPEDTIALLKRFLER